MLLTTLLAQAKDKIDLGSFKTLEDQSPYNKGSDDPTTVVTNLTTVVSNIVGFITVLAALFFIVYTFTAAFSWVTAGGDSGKIEKARDRLVQGVLGLILIVAAYGIIELIGAIIGLDLLNIQQSIVDIVPKK